MLRRQSRTWPYLRFVKRRQGDGEAGRHHCTLTRLQRHRLAIRHSRAQVHAGCVGGLVSGEGKALEVRQRDDADGDGHEAAPESSP